MKNDRKQRNDYSNGELELVTGDPTHHDHDEVQHVLQLPCRFHVHRLQGMRCTHPLLHALLPPSRMYSIFNFAQFENLKIFIKNMV